MKQFEYKMVKMEVPTKLFKINKVNSNQVLETLNQWGKEGWELAATIDQHFNGAILEVQFIFKREL